MKVLIREGQQQFIKELMLKSSCLGEDEFGREVSPVLPADREVCTGMGMERVLLGTGWCFCGLAGHVSLILGVWGS